MSDDKGIDAAAASDGVRLARVRAFTSDLVQRRSVRRFAPEPVSQDVIRAALEAAVSAPSGANLQPWRFVAISDPALKRALRDFAEAEEREIYGHNADAELIRAVSAIRRSDAKPYFEEAAWVIAVFTKRAAGSPDGSNRTIDDFYAAESSGIAVGFLLAALHAAGLATLTHVPVAEEYLADACGKTDRERLFLLVLAGVAAEGHSAHAPQKKSFHTMAEFLTRETV